MTKAERNKNAVCQAFSEYNPTCPKPINEVQSGAEVHSYSDPLPLLFKHTVLILNAQNTRVWVLNRAIKVLTLLPR